MTEADSAVCVCMFLCIFVTGNQHVFTWRRQQVVDVDGFGAVGSSEQLLL